MGRPRAHFTNALRYLKVEWERDEVLVGDLKAYLTGMVREVMGDLEGADAVDLMLAADCLRAHRASVELKPDAMTRSRLLSAQDSVWSRLRKRYGGKVGVGHGSKRGGAMWEPAGEQTGEEA